MGKHDQESVCTYSEHQAKADGEALRVARVLLRHLRQATRCQTDSEMVCRVQSLKDVELRYESLLEKLAHETGCTQYEDILGWVQERKKQAREVLDSGVPF